jgi:inward rectifier potassium channel
VSTGPSTKRAGPYSFAREGLGWLQRDAYHYLLEASWPKLVAILLSLYVAGNALFAAAYLLEPGAIENARPGSFADAFFFSVQTMATIGYGKLLPATTYANLLVVLEASTGILGLAMLTGLIFAKFSRPSARVLFSTRAVVTTHDGVPSLLVRMANARSTWIVEAEAHLVLIRWEHTSEGETVRRFHDLETTHARNAIFALTWSMVHHLTESSPLHGATPESLAANESEIVVSVVGLDPTLSQTVHARHSYAADDIVWGARFADVVMRLPDGGRRVDLARFHDVVEDVTGLPPWLTRDGTPA